MAILPLALNAVLYLNSDLLLQIEFGLVQQSVFIYNIYPRIFFVSFLWFISTFISIVLKSIINCLGNDFSNYFSMGQQSRWQLSIIKANSECWIYTYIKWFISSKRNFKKFRCISFLNLQFLIIRLLSLGRK